MNPPVKWIPNFSDITLYSLSRTFSGIYCLMVIAIYISLIVNKFVSSPMRAPEMEVSALMMYLYLGSCSFLIYFLCVLVKSSRTYDNVKSHGSGFLRQGAFVFGIGSFIYHLLEFITHFIIDFHPNCLDVLHTVNSFLSIIFVLLQAGVIIIYPRLNLHLDNGLPHLGLMHLVTTNLIIWARTVIKESLHTYHEAQQYMTKNNTVHDNYAHEIPHSAESSEEVYEETMSHIMHKRSASPHLEPEQHLPNIEHFDLQTCTENFHDDDFVVEVLNQTSPFLLCFIVEFSLVGSTVFYNTWNNVHISNQKENGPKNSKVNNVRKPNLCATLAKTNWSNSTVGTSLGSMVLFLIFFDLIMFFSANHFEGEPIFEYLGKILHTFINFLAVFAAMMGFIQVQKLTDKYKNTSLENGVSIDMFLLNFGVFFIYIYSCLTITVGVFNIDTSIPGCVHILNGIMEIIAVTFQTILIHQLLIKTIEGENAYLHGRQIVAFLSFVNFSIWLFYSFELPRSKASYSEAHFYGHLQWVWLQRITLPICIFYRFHSTVVLVDCWKHSYRRGALESLITSMNEILVE